MNNIYKKQQLKLGLTVKQYAKLLNMPYEIVNDFVNNKEGNYSMEIKNLFRKNMLNEHQNVEENIENAKIEIVKMQIDEKDLLDWYYNRYDKVILWVECNVKSTYDFIRKYEFKINDKEISRWFYNCIINKNCLNKCSKEVICEIAKILYDIIVNHNKELYIRKDFTLINTNKKLNNVDVKCKKASDYELWFETFNFRKFIDDNKLSISNVADEIGIGKSTLFKIASPITYYKPMLNIIMKIKNYVDNFNIEAKIEKEENIEIIDNESIIEEIEEEYKTVEEVFMKNDIEELKKENTLLKEMLKNRLTEEEKLLLKLFG